MLNVEIETTFSFDYRFMNNSVLTIPGSMQNSNNFMISPVTISSAGEYTCTVTVNETSVCGESGSESVCSSKTSAAVTLTVQCEL